MLSLRCYGVAAGPSADDRGPAEGASVAARAIGDLSLPQAQPGAVAGDAEGASRAVRAPTARPCPDGRLPLVRSRSCPPAALLASGQRGMTDRGRRRSWPGGNRTTTRTEGQRIRPWMRPSISPRQSAPTRGRRPRTRWPGSSARRTVPPVSAFGPGPRRHCAGKARTGTPISWIRCRSGSGRSRQCSGTTPHARSGPAGSPKR